MYCVFKILSGPVGQGICSCDLKMTVANSTFSHDKEYAGNSQESPAGVPLKGTIERK
jgi:hypothetical protein